MRATAPSAASAGYAPADAPGLVLDNMFQFAGVLDRDGVLLEANRAALSFAGSAREDVIGRPFWETPWWRNADQERLRDAVHAAAAGEFVRYEVDVRGAAATLTIDFSLTPVRDDTHQVVRIVAEGRDITEYRRTREELRLSQARLAGIISVAVDAIITVDEVHRILIFNTGAEEIFGWKAEEVLGQPLDVLLPELVRERHRAHMARFAASGEAARRMGERQEIHGRRRDGSLFPAEASISRIEVDGRLFLTAVLRDISDRKRAEEELRALLALEHDARTEAQAAEARAHFLSEASALLDQNLDLERTLRDLAGLIVPSFASCLLLDLVDEKGLPRRIEARHGDPTQAEIARRLLAFPRHLDRPYLMRQTIEDGVASLVTDITDAHLASIAQDEEHLGLLRQLAPTSYLTVPLVAHGRILGGLGFITDASRAPYTQADLRMAVVLGQRGGQAIENAQLYQAARSATQLREEMLGIVSHDLRNPISAIAMCSSVLLEMPPQSESERTQRLLRTIVHSTEWAQRMIADLLDVASIESGRLSLERGTVHLAGVLARATELFQGQAAEQGITLELSLEDAPPIVADQERILQVLANLVANSLKFTPSGGQIELALRHDDTHAVVTVADTGRGIPAEHLPHVFDRFWQARRGASSRGTGLGLSICRGLVEAHGGSIAVESEPGRGTLVRFTLPLLPPAAG